MPTENWYSIAEATHDLPASSDEWTNSGGANKNASVQIGGGRTGAATHDDDTTYIATAVASADQAVNISWPGPMRSWDGVFTANMRTRSSGGTVSRQVYTKNAAGTYSVNPILAVSEGSGGYITTGPADLSGGGLVRAGGGSWVVSDFADDKTMFMNFFRVSGATVLATSVWGTMSFTPAGGSFMFILGLVGLAALPFLGTMTDRVHFDSYLDWRTVHHARHTTWAPGERDMAWADIKAYKSPTWYNLSWR